MEQLWERSEEGRKETNRKPSTGTGKEGTGDQAGKIGETGEAKAETGTEEATVRRNREEKERKKQRLSSEMLKRKRTQGSGSQASIPEERSKREAPVERLRERNWEGRKETNSRAEYENRERKHGKLGWKERGKPGSESGEAAPGKPL